MYRPRIALRGTYHERAFIIRSAHYNQCRGFDRLFPGKPFDFLVYDFSVLKAKNENAARLC
jgi:hypothetical protein